MKIINPIVFALAVCCTIPLSANAQEGASKTKDYGPCFKGIEQKIFDEAEKEVGPSLRFASRNSSVGPRLSLGGFRNNDGSVDVSIYFPPIEKTPELASALLVRIVIAYEDGKRETVWLQSNGRLDSLKNSVGKRIATPYIHLLQIPKGAPKYNVIDITAITTPGTGKRTKFIGSLPDANG